jgi:hypothetical protein
MVRVDEEYLQSLEMKRAVPVNSTVFFKVMEEDFVVEDKALGELKGEKGNILFSDGVIVQPMNISHFFKKYEASGELEDDNPRYAVIIEKVGEKVFAKTEIHKLNDYDALRFSVIGERHAREETLGMAINQGVEVPDDKDEE